MVYLFRTVKMKGNWEKMEEVTVKFLNHWRKMKQVKSAEFWGNISGDQEEGHIVVGFESLADEEQFVMQLMNDDKFEEIMTQFVEVYTIGSDRLFRVWTEPK